MSEPILIKQFYVETDEIIASNSENELQPVYKYRYYAKEYYVSVLQYPHSCLPDLRFLKMGSINFFAKVIR